MGWNINYLRVHPVVGEITNPGLTWYGNMVREKAWAIYNEMYLSPLGEWRSLPYRGPLDIYWRRRRRVRRVRRVRTKKFSDFAENWLSCSSRKINVRNFRVFWFCSKKVEKNPIQVWKWENFSPKIPSRRGLFFEISDFAENWLSGISRKINVRNFRVFWFCSTKVEKNPIQVWKFLVQKSPLEEAFFLENGKF